MRRETDFVLEKAAWPALVLDAGGRICRANQAARRVFEFTGDSAASTLAGLWSQENPTPADKFLTEQNEGTNAQVKLRLTGGRLMPFFGHLAKVVRDEQDYFVLQLFKEAGAAFTELAYVPTPQPAAPAEKKDQTFSALMDAAWPALVVDKEGKIVRANKASATVFGSNAVAAGAPLNGLVAPEEAASSPANPLKVRKADGQMAPFRIESCPAGDGMSVMLQFFKAVEKSEPQKKEKAAEEEFVLQNAEWPVLLAHKSGKVLRANRAAVQTFGPSIEREEAQLGAIWSPQNKDSSQHLLNLPPPAEPVSSQFVLKSGLPVDFAVQLCPAGRDEVFVLQLLRPVNRATASAPEPAVPAPAPMAVPLPTQAPVPDAAPAPVAADAAAKGGVEGNLAHKQKLDCALQLARSVALDFNNALTSILGHTSLLLSKAEQEHPWRNSLGEIEKSAARAAEIANDLAAFSRQEKDSNVQVAGNLNVLLERTVEAFQGSLTSTTTISRQLERKLFTAKFDEAKMQQALVKILENSVEAMKGPGKINVLTRNLELTEPTQDRTARLNPGNYVCVEISDTGAGIPDDVMPHIFEPFFSTKGSRHRGLGLAWVYGIVTNHGGGVAVSSQLDVGTTVRLYLPANRKIVRDAPVADGDLSGTQTILLVDDEDLLLTMGRMVLSSYGYTVLTANSGQKALELFTKSKDRVNLVITDLVMPNMSGRELSEHILKAAPDTRIIWSSGYVRSANAQEQERYLQKPFTSQDLLRKVKQVLAA